MQHHQILRRLLRVWVNANQLRSVRHKRLIRLCFGVGIGVIAKNAFPILLHAQDGNTNPVRHLPIFLVWHLFAAIQVQLLYPIKYWVNLHTEF